MIATFITSQIRIGICIKTMRGAVPLFTVQYITIPSICTSMVDPVVGDTVEHHNHQTENKLGPVVQESRKQPDTVRKLCETQCIYSTV